MAATPAAVAAFKPGLTRAESRAVAEAVASGWVGGGIYVRLLERRIAEAAGAPRAVAAASGTAALHLALRALGVADGEVVLAGLASPAVAHAVLYSGAAPVFCDVRSPDGNIDPAQAARLMTRRTRAVIGVHFNGEPCDMDSLRELCRARGAALIEDAGGCLPGDGLHKGRPLGSLGDLACFSFGRKNFTTLDGGAVLCRDEETAARLRRLRNLGQPEGDRPRDRAAAGISELGFPYRMNDMAAVLGLSQLARMPAVLARLRRMDRLYRDALEDAGGLAPPAESSGSRRSLSCFAVRAEGGRKKALRTFLEGRGVLTDDWLTPAHLHPLYKPFRRALPAAERLAEELLYLPFYPGLTDSQACRVASALRAFRRRRL